MLVKLLATALVILAFGVFVWATDKITFEGERTVYTVTCGHGTWERSRCTSRLATSDRYTFKASRSRQEVLYWVVGSKQPSGKYTDCQVANRGNWTCNVRVDQPMTITYEMKNDRPAHGAEGLALPFYAVPKWKWWAIRYGIGRYSDAGL
jgi:hypothetical protein